MTAMVCRGCGGTFRPGFTRCASCNMDLVDPAELQARRPKVDAPRAALAGVPCVTVLHAGLAACREIEGALLAEGIPCFVEASAEEGEVLAPGAMKVGVVVAEADLPRVAELLRKRFEDLVAREGVGSFASKVVDLSAAEVECPACGHKGPLREGACGDCGLFLGAPE